MLLSTCTLIYGKESKENLDLLKKEVDELLKDVEKGSHEKRQKNIGMFKYLGSVMTFIKR